MNLSNLFDKEVFLKDAVEISTSFFNEMRSCLILAPHPDDESLGCGGLIALLSAKKISVSVAVSSDGTKSHPKSKKFPAAKLATLRKMEVKTALKILGVEDDKIYFLEGKDAALPGKGEDGFHELANKLKNILTVVDPQLVLVPYQLDPHRDHRATWQLLNEILENNTDVKVWEYLIWLYELAAESDIPDLQKGELKKLDIQPYLPLKEKAIYSHVSQTTRLIDDDLTGFILKPEVISHFTTKFEYYLDRR